MDGYFMYYVTLFLQDDDSEEADVTEDTTHDHAPAVPVATSSEISLSQSAWDDETPGPSYSTLSQPQTEEVEPEGNQLGGTSPATEQREHNDDGKDEEDECMIVGYVKPMAERTPELVQLSSDSTEEEEEAAAGKEAAATETVMKAESSLPYHEQAPLSPKPCPSTSHTERGENLEQSREQDAGKHSHRGRKEHTPRRGFRKPSHSLSGSLSHMSSESSPQSGHSVKISRSTMRLSCGESGRQGHSALGRSPTLFAARDVSSSEELVPNCSVSTRDKSSKSFSPWDSPGHDGERKRKRRKRRREKETERSRSPHRESRHRHGDRELWLGSSSSSDADSRREKPAGKRKYKTRHLERTARRRSRRKSRERSPSVEIVFERRASGTHSRARRHKRRSRRKDRQPNSPTIITIDSDSSSHHTAECPSRHAEANSHAAEYQTRLMGGDKDAVANDKNADYQDRTGDDSEHVTDFSDHTIDYQEHLAEFSDRTTDDKDCAADDRNCTADYKDRVSGQSCGSVFSDPAAEHKDGVAGGSGQTSDYKDKDAEVGKYITDSKLGVQTASDQAAEHQDHAGVSAHAADYNHAGTEVDGNRGYRADSKPSAAEVNTRTIDYPGALLDVDDSPDDFLMDIGNRAESHVSVVDMLNLEHCLVDVVQPNRRVDGDSRRAATPLSDTQLLEPEDRRLGEGRGTIGNNTVDQQEAGLVAHRDQSETVTRGSPVSAEMSPDV